MQIPAIIQIGPSFDQILKNAATSRIYGVELSGAWKATDEFSLEAGGTYLNAHYTNFPDAAVDVPIGGNTGNNVVSENVSGNTMVGSPVFSANLTANYVKDTSVGRFDASGTVYYSTKLFFDVGDRITQPNYATLNAAFAWQPVGTDLQFRLWGKNLTDRAVLVSTTISTFADGVHWAAPRTFGAEARYRF
jgi:iron complex outermembrane receptor protein